MLSMQVLLMLSTYIAQQKAKRFQTLTSIGTLLWQHAIV